MNTVSDNDCAERSSPSNSETMWIMSERFSDDDVLARIIWIHCLVFICLQAT